jgi:signal transduction histidine kinase
MNSSDSQTQRIAELEQRVAQLTEQNSAAMRELEAFVYAVSHDLRAPLRSISGFGQALLETLDTRDDKARHYLERIQQASRKMSELIDALLALSRISRIEMHPRDFDFTELCIEASNSMKLKHANKFPQIAIAPGLRTFADQRLVRTAIELLLDNAFKFSNNPPIVEIGQNAEGAFYVRDHGVGFDMAYIDKLFKPFQRLHADTDFPGLGVGLATVQRIIARHNGRIWIIGAPNSGTTVLFTLGLAQGTPAPSPT